MDRADDSHNKYQIAYIDENPGDVKIFHDFMKRYRQIVEFKKFIPKKGDTIESLYEKIKANQFNMLVIDYRLNQYADVDFLGSNLLNYIQERQRDLPCILLTSYPDEAVDDFSDVHLIYDKNMLSIENWEYFFKIIKASIDKYINQKTTAYETIKELGAKTSLSLKEEALLIQADEFIEANLGLLTITPPQLKSISHNQELKNLVDEVQELLEKLDNHEIPNKKKDT